MTPEQQQIQELREENARLREAIINSAMKQSQFAQWMESEIEQLSNSHDSEVFVKKAQLRYNTIFNTNS